MVNDLNNNNDNNNDNDKHISTEPINLKDYEIANDEDNQFIDILNIYSIYFKMLYDKEKILICLTELI